MITVRRLPSRKNRPVNCAHVWSDEYHTHLGHPEFGAHSAHRTCKLCGGVQSRYASGLVFNKAGASTYWDILPRPHTCREGWRGVSTLNKPFGEGLPPLPGRKGKAVSCPNGCPCCHAVQTQDRQLCPRCVLHEAAAPCNRIATLTEERLLEAEVWNAAYGLSVTKGEASDLLSVSFAGRR